MEIETGIIMTLVLISLDMNFFLKRSMYLQSFKTRNIFFDNFSLILYTKFRSCCYDRYIQALQKWF